jgi:uncharacterized repeat protein (TIGR01451 family)
MSNSNFAHRLRKAGVAVGLSALSLAALASTSAAAAPSAAWRVVQTTTPTNLVPGSAAEPGLGVEARGGVPKYKIAITNIGGTPVTPNATIIDTLPSGITVAPGDEPAMEVLNPSTGIPEQLPCASVAQTVTCEVTVPTVPNVTTMLYVPIAVGAEAPGEVTNTVQVSSPETRPVTSELTSRVTNDPPPFDFVSGPDGLDAGAFDSAGEPPAAGAHPFSLLVQADLPTVVPSVAFPGILTPMQPLRALEFTLPPGLVFNPNATAVRCTRVQFEGEFRVPAQECPPESQVGYVTLNLIGLEQLSATLFNLTPEPNAPAELGFGFLNTQVRLRGGLDGSFRLTAGSSELLTKYKIVGALAQLWGNPSDPQHDPLRSGQGCAVHVGCAVERLAKPLLTMPSACSSSLPFSATAASWLGPVASGERVFTNAVGEPEAVEGCERLGFEPTVAIQPESTATETPTGLSVDIKVPQNENAYGLASATLKKAVVQLPPGMRINPPASNGLSACSVDQIGVGNNLPANCPASSKVGAAEIITPLLTKPLQGNIYLAEQDNNPFGTLLALYLVVEGEGIVIKLPGRIDADGQTGQLTATFDNNPQQPFNELKAQFFGGNGAPRASLVTPASCGTYAIHTELTSWASPVPVSSSNPFTIDQGCGNGGFNPNLSAGTTNPSAGRYSPFTLRVTRNDGEQNLARVAATLPEGLLAKLAGVPLCGDTEAATGNCPSQTQIGTTTTGVGAGTQPLFIPQPGKAPTAVYLAGPYHGAPYSMVVKVPAQAGPFDLGTIAVRVALDIDPFTAKVTATSDPLPQILEGIPVEYRDVRVNVDRPEFILNPTSCEPMKIESTLTSATGVAVTPSQRFQVAGCESLGFKPSLKLTLKGSTKRTGHPSLKAVVTYPKQGAYANIARAQVGLPPSEFLDQGNLNQVCKQADLRAGTCPASTIYGHAKAWSPLLDRPLEGPVYLGVGFGYKLPALVADLNGQVRILLKGKVDTTKQKGLRNTFEAVPDAPVSRFVLEMKGGKRYGLLENSENTCRKPQHASALFSAQNGKSLQLQPKIANNCKGSKKKTK